MSATEIELNIDAKKKALILFDRDLLGRVRAGEKHGVAPQTITNWVNLYLTEKAGDNKIKDEYRRILHDFGREPWTTALHTLIGVTLSKAREIVEHSDPSSPGTADYILKLMQTCLKMIESDAVLSLEERSQELKRITEGIPGDRE